MSYVKIWYETNLKYENIPKENHKNHMRIGRIGKNTSIWKEIRELRKNVRVGGEGRMSK